MFVRACRIALIAVAALSIGSIASAQQRPFVTEDPEVIGAGRLLLEAGIEGARGAQFPLSGLEGSLWKLPTVGLSVGISPIAEFQLDSGLFSRLSIRERHAAPLSALVDAPGTDTHDVEDAVVATKVRILSESASRPSFALRFATRLPNARNESGLGLDTVDAFASVLSGKTVQSVRIVVNGGVGILGDPLHGYHQQTAFTYGVSVARAISERTELALDVNGRYSPGDAPPAGTESRGRVTLGARHSRGALRFDAGVLIGATALDPSIGITAGVTWVVQAFAVP
jgi:hypothetical protein